MTSSGNRLHVSLAGSNPPRWVWRCDRCRKGYHDSGVGFEATCSHANDAARVHASHCPDAVDSLLEWAIPGRNWRRW